MTVKELREKLATLPDEFDVSIDLYVDGEGSYSDFWVRECDGNVVLRPNDLD